MSSSIDKTLVESEYAVFGVNTLGTGGMGIPLATAHPPEVAREIIEMSAPVAQ